MLNQYRSRLLTSTLLVSAALATQPAFAQSTSAPAATDATPAPTEIVVTGSLIRNPNLVASTPVNVVGAAEINLRQVSNAEEVLRDIPGAVPSIGAQVNNGNGGSSYADLRGLGNFRNVVLLDGTRITPASVVGRTDLNNIPLALIDRVDTTTGGAATTYGADAVSGVINFITRRDFSGVELNVGESITGQGDGEAHRADLTVGANFDDGRGNVVLSVGYQKTHPVYQGDRKIGQNNYTSTSGGKGGSGTTVPGRFVFSNGDKTATGSNNNIIDPSTGLLRPYKSSDGYNYNPFNIYQTPFERYNIYGAGHYDISDSIEVYTRGMFSKNKVNTIIAPSGVFASLLTIPYSSPYLPANTRTQFCTAYGLTTAQCNAAAAATSPTDPNFKTFTTTVGRRMPETGPRVSQYSTTMFDYRAGAKFNITSSISLDVSGSYGESENRQTETGYVLLSRVRTAVYTTSTTSCNLGSSPTVNNSNPLLPPLANAGAGTTGCVPLNIFGPAGSITPAMASYLTGTATNAQFASLGQARALLSGDFGGYHLPWADQPVSFALGGEYRNYRGNQSADALSQTAGELGGAGGAVLNYSGAYDVREAYAELNAPIVADKPGFNSLTLEAGVRYSDYKVKTTGNPGYNTTTYKGGATWEPVRGIKIRGDYQRAVRAPNIAELFAPTVTGLTTVAVDPCSGSKPVNSAALRAVCLAQGAPAATIGSISNPTAAQANITTAGGTYLRPESSDSYTIGVVLQPSFVPGLSISVDYYKIKIKHAISQPTTGDLINGCFGDSSGSGVTAASLSNPICALFKRNPVTGGLDGDPATTQGLIVPSSNSGKIMTDGIDVVANYRRDLGFAKLNMSFNGNWTHASKFQSIVAGSVIPVGYPGAGSSFGSIAINRECVGLYGADCGSPGSAGPSSSPGSLQPEFTWSQRTTLTFGAIDLSLNWRHISKMRVEDGVTYFAGTISSGALAGTKVNFGRIPSYNYFDLSGRVAVSNNLDVTLTVTNLFDKDPPIVGGTIGTTSYNSGNTFPSTYDPLGRRFALGARLKF
ncbi:TonB-dependent receptor domain-containing protein [Sphingomonas sp. MMS24-J13]|uniref:TonB-dependent receptor domain-containing protein n=1 Tax=Sphingomonas sp. MMS24-J13 TaxID=3238686 RepID=UPI00384B0EEB